LETAETGISMKKWPISTALLSTALLTLGSPYALADDSSDLASHDQHEGGQPTTTSTAQYAVPDLTLVRDDGKSISLPQEMNDGRPVVLNFIFTSCGSICPLMSQVFAQFQRKLGPEANKIHLMSISTDPEEDTPARLTEYARKFRAGPEWQHYTGTVTASLAAQRAFDVYRGDKMSHTPVTLLRAAPGQAWRRIDGFVTPDELLREYRQLLASK
jgi:protein SCO1/2